MGIIDTTSKPLPPTFAEVISVTIQNLRVCLDCKTTADVDRLKDALEEVTLAVSVLTRDVNSLTNTPNLKGVPNE